MKASSSLIVLSLVLLWSCAAPLVISDDEEPGAEVAAVEEAAAVRNVILVVGDGMGPQQVGLLWEYAHRAPNSVYSGQTTAMERFIDEGVLGLAMHGPQDALVVDSACSATQLATGQPSISEAVGLDAEGNPARTILEIARDQGKATGLVSDTRITHATPASFGSHVAHRSMENEIAEMLLAARVDVLFSGGLRHFVPRGGNEDEALREALQARIGQAYPIASRRRDEENLLDRAEAAGYELLFDRAALQEASAAGTAGPLLGLFASSGMLDAIEERQTRDAEDRREPALHEMALVALDVLDQRDEGFFLMIEAGQIDWAGHDNDAGFLLHEMLRMDELLAALHGWLAGREDTLVLITADHETGGFGFSYSAVDLPEAQELPGEAFADRLFQPDFNFGDLAILDGLLAQTKTFGAMLEEHRRGTDGSALALVEIVNAHSAFPITEEDAEAILRTEGNPHRVEGHRYLGAVQWPVVEDFSEFYVYGEEVRRNVLGRALAAQQNVVWSTGAHTHTPVPVIAWGPRLWTQRFDRLQHLSDVGKVAIEAVQGEVIQP